MRTHFIGIGGIGMSALAHLLLDRQQSSAISGSDRGKGPILNQLLSRGAAVHSGHGADVLPSYCDRVVVSSAIQPEHVELQAARQRGIPILHRSDLLAEQMHLQEPLLVAGTHGKTTTSALLGWTLYQAGWDPSLAIGGVFKEVKETTPRHGHLGKGLYFVAEADESDGTFLKYHGQCAIVTNLDRDHLDHFKSEQTLKQAFKEFCLQQPRQGLFWCFDDPNLLELGLPGVSYGRSEKAAWRCSDIRQDALGLLFTVRSETHCFENLRLPLWGEHNALNATAVVALLCHLGLREADIREGFTTFPGVQRRCQVELESPYVIMHDYGHHPAEIQATLEGLRKRYQSNRLIVVFQPHRYTRTQDLTAEFGHAMGAADFVISTDIYAAAEKPIPGVTGEALVAAIQTTLGQKTLSVPVQYLARHELLSGISNMLKPNDVWIFFGAGDIDGVAKELAQKTSICGTSLS